MQLELHTERLKLTPLTFEDVDIEVELWTDERVAQYAGGAVSEQHIRDEMTSWVRRGGEGGIGAWCVSLRDSNEKIGDAYLLPLPIDVDDWDLDALEPGKMPEGDIEIGYFLKPAAWGRGYATEICKRLVDFAFETVGLDEVVASIYEDNEASKHVLQKCGLVYAGKIRCYASEYPVFKMSRDQWTSLERVRSGRQRTPCESAWATPDS